eukprot:TRINITY_DN5335_c0_g1_i1.p1 TRINITY_DN5335_c0_g1~~TRINITY_DN5335_c0_g1_i1.p1  ORF type:complete len:1014 (-),score=137.83 TRINITY_DN5335_c0_g1_i1:29-3070(-)
MQTPDRQDQLIMSGQNPFSPPGSPHGRSLSPPSSSSSQLGSGPPDTLSSSSGSSSSSSSSYSSGALTRSSSRNLFSESPTPQHQEEQAPVAHQRNGRNYRQLAEDVEGARRGDFVEQSISGEAGAGREDRDVPLFPDGQNGEHVGAIEERRSQNRKKLGWQRKVVNWIAGISVTWGLLTIVMLIVWPPPIGDDTSKNEPKYMLLLIPPGGCAFLVVLSGLVDLWYTSCCRSHTGVVPLWSHWIWVFGIAVFAYDTIAVSCGVMMNYIGPKTANLFALCLFALLRAILHRTLLRSLYSVDVRRKDKVSGGENYVELNRFEDENDDDVDDNDDDDSSDSDEEERRRDLDEEEPDLPRRLLRTLQTLASLLCVLVVVLDRVVLGDATHMDSVLYASLRLGMAYVHAASAKRGGNSLASAFVKLAALVACIVEGAVFVPMWASMPWTARSSGQYDPPNCVLRNLSTLLMWFLLVEFVSTLHLLRRDRNWRSCSFSTFLRTAFLVRTLFERPRAIETDSNWTRLRLFLRCSFLAFLISLGAIVTSWIEIVVMGGWPNIGGGTNKGPASGNNGKGVSSFWPDTLRAYQVVMACLFMTSMGLTLFISGKRGGCFVFLVPWLGFAAGLANMLLVIGSVMVPLIPFVDWPPVFLAGLTTAIASVLFATMSFDPKAMSELTRANQNTSRYVLPQNTPARLSRMNKELQEVISDASFARNWRIEYSDLQVYHPPIGNGAFGVVSRASYHGTDVAVKTYMSDFELTMRDWVTEVEHMSALRHPNIVILIGACEDPLCIVTEYAAHGSLFAVIHKTPEKLKEWPTVVSVALGAAKGLSFLHAQSPPVLHRDMKSGNILLDANMIAKVADFGLSRSACTVTMTNRVGTTRWMAPEVVNHSKNQSSFVPTDDDDTTAIGHYGEPADVYSFGMVMYELYTLNVPFFEEAWEMNIERRVLDGELPKMYLTSEETHVLRRESPVPDEFVALIGSCLCLDPSSRPTMKEVTRTLEGMKKECETLDARGAQSV